eukprot:PITA_17092
MSGDRPAENPAPAPVRFALAPTVNQCIFARKEDAQIQHSPNYRNRRKQMRGSRRVLATIVHINLALIFCAMLVTGRVTVQRSVGISAQSMNLMDSRGKKGQVCETEASPDKLTLVLSFLKRCVPQFAGGEQIKTDHNMKKREERRLTGPGSSPPSCKSKCGRCVPCKPVHVPIQPGRKRTFEYYPEAWRCKCGNKLYMP